METTILEGQNILDIAIQEAGSFEAVFDLAVKNNLSITGDLPAGTKIKNVPPVNKSVADYFGMKKLKPATSGDLIFGGIGSMAIEIDFIVS